MGDGSDTCLLVDGVAHGASDVQDRGFQYGDGLFETLAVRDGHPRLWERHMARLAAGGARLDIPVPAAELLWEEATRLCGGAGRGVLKIIVTRGTGGRGYLAPPTPQPRRYVLRYPWPDYPPGWWQEGVAVRLCKTPLGCNPALAGIKHLNRLEQVLARNEWRDPDIAEGLMQDGAGRVIEGTMSNVFAVRDGCLLTPDVSRCGVAGIMRGLVLEAAAADGIPVEVIPLRLPDLQQADELFLTNSLIGVLPVRRLEDNNYRPGPLTRQLGAAVARDGG